MSGPHASRAFNKMFGRHVFRIKDTSDVMSPKILIRCPCHPKMFEPHVSRNLIKCQGLISKATLLNHICMSAMIHHSSLHFKHAKDNLLISFAEEMQEDNL